MTEPPYVLDSARVLAYAVLDQTVSYTGRISVYVGGKLLPPIPRLAICENLAREGDFLLCYCTETWEVLGVGGYESFELAKQRAEVAYAGVSEKWEPYRPLSERELAYIDKVRRFVRSEAPTGPYPKPPKGKT
jgi:hypothetical protein